MVHYVLIPLRLVMFIYIALLRIVWGLGLCVSFVLCFVELAYSLGITVNFECGVLIGYYGVCGYLCVG